MRPLLSKALAEAIGTFSLVFAGCGAIAISGHFPKALSSSSIPLVFGLVVAVMIYAIGHISGAHFNPAVTFAFTLVRCFSKKQMFVYWFAQFFGSILAIGLLKILLPFNSDLGVTTPTLAEPIKAVIWEAILTFFLMFVIVAVATDTRAEGSMAGMAIGATVTLCAFIGGPITGASMNPARSLAPALIQENFNLLWIYFLCPTIGATVAAFCYEIIRCGHPSKKSMGCC